MSDDPGGNFASDEHRRVMAIVANDDQSHRTEDEVAAGVELDDHLELDPSEAGEYLADLEADGDVTQTKDGWKPTKAGLGALNGPPATDGGRAHD